jgi:tetratricopeptide (TPR) repeat protein
MVTDLPALLHRLERTAATPDAAAEPEDGAHAADCDDLADALLGLGATAASARWRTLALLPPAPSQLAAALSEVRLLLLGLGVLASEQTSSPPEPEADPLARARQLLAGSQPLPPPTEVAELAEALVAADDPDGALQLLRLQAVMGNLHPDACLAVASLLARLQQPWDGERWFRAGLQRLPDPQRLPRHWFQLARLLHDLAEWDGALAAVEQGLAMDPVSNWGRNLRARILLGGGGRHSFDQLAATPDALPDDPALCDSLLEDRRRWSRAPLGPAPPPDPLPLSLPQRMQLRRQLGSPQLVVLLHGHGAEPLLWLQAQDVLPAGLTVQPLASREPLPLAAALTSAGFLVRSEQPSSLLTVMAEEGSPPVDLLVVQRPGNGRLPAALGPLLAKVRCVLTPRGLLTPSAHARLAAHGGWLLLGLDE